MKDSGDLAVIGIPFAAGVAAGAFLFPGPTGISITFPLALSALLALSSISALFLLDNSSGYLVIRAAFASMFLAAGLFCSLNSVITGGIVIGDGPLTRMALAGGARLKDVIDSIPYPSDVTGPLVKALVTGDRSGLGKDVVDVFRASGASHILALSGLHLGVLYLLLSKLLVPLGNSPVARMVKYVLTVGLSGLYALATGASPSIVRAFLFITIGETAKLTGRKRIPSRILLAALTIQLAVKPEVITTLGFQLSYLAMTGIVLLYPKLERIYPEGGRIDPMRKIWQAAVLSVSCQVTTAPLVWLRFRTFPGYFLITNLTALPLTSAVVVLSVTTIALYPMGICPEILIRLNDLAAELLVSCLQTVSSM